MLSVKWQALNCLGLNVLNNIGSGNGLLPASHHVMNQCWLNTLRQGQYGRHFPDDIFKCIFLNETIGILIEISLKFVPRGPINNIPALVQIMAWHKPGGKPLSKLIMVTLPMQVYASLSLNELVSTGTSWTYSMKFSLMFKNFHSRKYIWKCHLQNVSHFFRPLCVTFFNVAHKNFLQGVPQGYMQG